MADLEAEVGRLRTENERLKALVEELRRGGKRQAAPFAKGPPKPDPRPPGRKSGEAYGRHAHREPPAEWDEEHEALLPKSCPHCGCPNLQETQVAEQYQVEIPRQPLRRKFRVHVGRCRHCGRRVQGRHALQTSDALGAAASQLGPDAQALAVHLNKEAGLSHGKVCRVFQAAFGILLSRGGSAQIILRAGERCAPQYREILLYVRHSPAAYADETGWRVGGLLWWLWAFVTRAATAYVIRHSRGGEVPQEILGPDYAGLFGHDGWRPYEALEHARHQTCLQHLLHRAHNLLETATRGAVRFPRAVKEVLLDSLALRDRRDAQELSPHGLAVATGRLGARLDRLLAPPKSNPDNERFANHLRRNRHWIFTFLREPEMEATDWMGEQAMRPAVVNRKVWGGNRTPAGAQAQERLLSVLRTCWQQHRCALDFISQVLRAPSGHAPRLLANPAPT
jgi:transposase